MTDLAYRGTTEELTGRPDPDIEERPRSETMEALASLLVEDKDTGIWFQLVCESGTDAIEAQAWQVADVLRVLRDEARDAMLELAHELLPESPAGAEDPRDAILRKAMTYLNERSVPYVPLDVEEDINKSYEEDDLEGFREVVRGWIRELTRRS